MKEGWDANVIGGIAIERSQRQAVDRSLGADMISGVSEIDS